MNDYQSKRVKVEAFTFAEVLEGKEDATIVNGVPWSFIFKGHFVTHERDDWYLINADGRSWDLTPDSMLVFGPKRTYVCGRALFDVMFEDATEDASNGVLAAAEAVIEADRAQVLTTEHINALDNAIKIQRGQVKVPSPE